MSHNSTSTSIRSKQRGGSRPALHTRQHSANTAGDVFAMFGSSNSAATPAAAPTTGSSSGVVVGTGEEDGRGASSSKQGLNNGSAHSTASNLVQNGASSPSSSGPSTPTSGSEKSRRFSSLYSPPVLLKLWNSELTAKIMLEDLYSAFEPPEAQQQFIQQQQQSSQDGTGSSKYGVSSLHSKRGAGDFNNPLGRLPGGTSTLQPGIRRTASGEHSRPHHHGIQGGVLSGVSPGASGATTDRGGIGGDTAFRAERGIGGRNARYGQRSLEPVDQPQSQPSSKSSGGPAWTSNRWRHLQPEDDSSGNSSPNEDAAEPWTTGNSSKSEWKPSAGSDLIQQERARLRSADTSLQDWDADDKQEVTPVPLTRSVDSPIAIDPPASRPPIPTSSSNRSLLMDDLLGPTRIPPAPSTETHSIAASLATGGMSTASSRSNSIVTPLSMLNIGGQDPSLSSSVRGGRQNGGNLTPSRAAAAEGLELLARRSPVQEVSMAALQGQYMPRSQPTPPPPFRQLPPEQIFWQYRDPSGQLQGPFSAVQMQDWYLQGFFSETLLVKRVEAADFETLGALVIRIGDASKPFLSNPAPRLFGPPGMIGSAFGQSSIAAQSPVAQRAVSPATWRSHTHGSQPTSREGSFSSASLPSAFPQDPFAQHHQLSSDTSVVQPPQQTYQVEQAAAPLDPWADMAPISQPVQRGSSALGGSEVMTPLDTNPHRRALAAQQAAIGPISPIVAHQTRQQESLPSPIGRASISSTLREVVPTKQEAQSPVVSSQSGQGISEAKQEIVEAKPTTAAADKKKASTVPATGETTTKSVLAADKPKQAVVLQPKPAEPTANGLPAEVKQGKVSTATQEAFQKQKKGETASTAKAELSFSSLVNDPSPAASPSASAPKAAPWAKGSEEDGKAVSTPTLTPSSSMSLREIQAKEQKEAEIRKAAEKRATAARIAAEEAASAERLAREAAESLPATSKWGDVASPAATPAPATSPWAKPVAPAATATTRSGTVKRTLKEIQEEEARQKKEAAAQAQARAKAYASSVSASNGISSPSSAAGNAGGAWTIVGSGSKPPVAIAPAVKPAPTAVKTVPAAPAPSMASRLAGSSIPSAPTKAASTVPSSSSIKVVPATANGRSASPVPPSKPDDTIAPASTELLKWCREALKGLDTIPVDDFISMLLSFPVPLDKSVRELVSDSVYSASRTLDGRHFADAFADKRAADTKAIKAGKIQPAASGLGSIGSNAAAAAQAKQPSMAEALKFIPAPKGPELNFKVVTKSKGKKK